MCYLRRLCLGGLASWRPGHAAFHQQLLEESLGTATRGDAAAAAGNRGSGVGSTGATGFDRPRSGSIAGGGEMTVVPLVVVEQGTPIEEERE